MKEEILKTVAYDINIFEAQIHVMISSFCNLERDIGQGCNQIDCKISDKFNIPVAPCNLLLSIARFPEGDLAIL